MAVAARTSETVTGSKYEGEEMDINFIMELDQRGEDIGLKEGAKT